jgi:hypothetical protein
MKMRIIFAVMTLALALGISVAAPAAPNAKAPAAQPAAAAQPIPAAAAAAQPVPPHPEIREAIESLRRARKHMMEAAHDYHGHREDAIRATDEAIKQLQLCLQFD